MPTDWFGVNSMCRLYSQSYQKWQFDLFNLFEVCCIQIPYHTIPYHPQMYANYEINVTYILFTIYIVWQLYDTQKPNEYNAFFITQWMNWNYLSLLNVNSICSTQLDFGSSMAFQMNFSLYLVLKLMSLSSAMIAKKVRNYWNIRYTLVSKSFRLEVLWKDRNDWFGKKVRGKGKYII